MSFVARNPEEQKAFEQATAILMKLPPNQRADAMVRFMAEGFIPVLVIGITQMDTSIGTKAIAETIEANKQRIFAAHETKEQLAEFAAYLVAHAGMMAASMMLIMGKDGK